MNDPIVIHGPEQAVLDPSLPDGGLPPAVGVHSACVLRASRDVPELSDGRGWTYHHHVDMACWKGRLYVGWNSCQRDEDVWPSRELFSTSIDGRAWSPPTEMFPQGLSTCLRVYFYLAPNGRMLAIAGLRSGIDKVSEEAKAALVVREIRADHTWGEVFTLQPPASGQAGPPEYRTCGDGAFVAACEALLADTVFLEQQDRGRLLGDRRMKWHDPSEWPGGKVPGDNEKWVAGKAYTFFNRPDGTIVGLSKMGWVTLSHDRGRSWSRPAVPPTLVMGKAKVFAHRTADGRYALVYNPSRRNRFPLAIVTGEDGVNFGDMRIVQGELPIQRYAGADRSIGPQYCRGVSKWADDGSRTGDRALWLAYSMNKEDIWVSRVPVPVRAEPGDKAPTGLDGWNLYVPKWASIEPIDDGLRLSNRDPFDHAIATRVFGASRQANLRLTVSRLPGSVESLEVNLLTCFGNRRPVKLAFRSDGSVTAMLDHRDVVVHRASPDEAVEIELEADVARARCVLRILTSGGSSASTLPFAEPSDDVHRITFRTGPSRGIGGKRPVAPGADRPVPESAFDLRCLNVVRTPSP
jgi:hypothetical protein